MSGKLLEIVYPDSHRIACLKTVGVWLAWPGMPGRADEEKVTLKQADRAFGSSARGQTDLPLYSTWTDIQSKINNVLLLS